MTKNIKIKNIAILMENYEYGGATTHLINLINSKKFDHVKFSLITNKSNKAKKNIINKCKKDKLKIVNYNSLFYPFFENRLFKLFHFLLKPILFIFSIFQMYIILKKIKFDILLFNLGGYGDFRSELGGILAAKLQNKNNLFLLIHHCYSKPFFWNNTVNKFLSFFLGLIVKRIIFVSKATKNNISKNTNLLKMSKIKSKIIYNGVDTKLSSRKNKKLFGRYKSKIKVLMLSRIEKYKGHEDFIEAFSRLPKKIKDKFQILFVGSGKTAYVLELKFKIEKLKLKKYFSFYNYLNYESIEIFKSVDIFFSLTRDFEGFGYSIAESLLAKTPVVATKVGGVVEFLNKHNSDLIEPKNIKKIEESLIRFTHDKNYFKTKSLKGSSLIKKKFNSELMGKNFYSYFHSNATL